MTPSPLDRKTKANEAEPRWRDRLVLTRVSPITKFDFLTSLCLVRQSPMLVTWAPPMGFFVKLIKVRFGGLAYSYSITQGSRRERPCSTGKAFM